MGDSEFLFYLLVGDATGHAEKTEALRSLETGGKVVDGVLRHFAGGFPCVGQQLCRQHRREAFLVVAEARDGIATAPVDPGALVQLRHAGLPFSHLVNQHQVALLQEVAVVGLLSIRRTQTQKADELSVSGNELLGLVLDMFIYCH